MEVVMWHEARQVPSWLIFDVRQRMEPLHAFIVSREVERTLPEMVAALNQFEGKSEIHFFDGVPASLRFRWESVTTIGEIVLRASGDCDVETVDMRTGEFSPSRYKRCVSKEEFYEMLSALVATISTSEKKA